MQRPLGRSVHVYAPRVAVPAESRWLELVAYTVPAGRLLIADLHQGVQSEVGGLLPLFQINGLSWDAYTAEGDGKNPKRLAISPNGSIDYTLTDGRPVIRGLVVEGGRRLVWGAHLDIDPLEGGIDYVFGAIVGLEVDANIDPGLLLELISRR